LREKTVMDGLVPSLGGHEINIKREKGTGTASPPGSPRRQSSFGLSAMNMKAKESSISVGSALKKEVDRDGSLSSAVASPKISINELSPAESLGAHTTNEDVGTKLELWCHVLLRERGEGRSVTAMETLQNGKKMAVLQEHG
jgi:hypothetical protein